MKSKEQLLKNIIGQLEGVGRMMEAEKDCFSVIVQIKAVKSALNNFQNKYLEENFNNCLKSCQVKDKQEMLKKLIFELTNNN